MRTTVRQVLHTIQRSPGFSLLVVGFLGLAVAAVLSLASAAWALLVKPLPYPQAERLAHVYGYSTRMGFELGFAVPLAVRLAELDSVEAVGYWRRGDEIEDGSGALLESVRISPSLLRMLAAAPVLGRLPNEDDPADAVVISEALWRQWFNRDPGVLDRPVDLPGRRLRVIGVMADDFAFPRAGIAIWQPLIFSPEQRAAEAMSEWGDLRVYVRMASGVDAVILAEQIAALAAAEEGLAAMREFMGLDLRVADLRASLSDGEIGLLSQVFLAIALILAAVVANLANLWLNRMLARQRELALRSALGASGFRRISPILIEVLSLTLAGVMLGVLLTPGGIAILHGLDLLRPNSALAVTVDGATVLLALALAVGLTLVLALPAIVLDRRVSLLASLGAGGRQVSSSPAGARLRTILVAVQVATAVGLLAGGGLLLRSLDALVRTETGFRSEHLLMAEMVPKDVRLLAHSASAGQRLAAWFDEASRLPGVNAASFANAPPFSRSESVSSFEVISGGDEDSARDRIVGPAYFDLLGQQPSQGRVFAERDADLPVVVVDERYVSRHLAGRDPLQTTIGVPVADDAYQPARIIGVVPTVKHLALDEAEGMGTVFRYSAVPAETGRLPRFILFDAGDPAALRMRLDELALRHGLRLVRFDRLSDWLRASLSDRMRLTGLLVAMAVVGLLLASMGLFALVQYTVRGRRRELALRMALGARSSDLSRRVSVDAVSALLPGLLLGLVAAVLVGEVLAARLHGIGPRDPLTLVLVVALLVPVALLSAWLPARRIAAIAPTEALADD